VYPAAAGVADVAIPLDKREGDSAFQVYISIGQAF
jgi:translocation and assembly module TamA